MASRCTLVTGGQVASITRSPRGRASSRTAGEMPWALKITVASSGTSSSSSTKMAPFWRSVSTTRRLCTISRRTYTGGGHTSSATSTMSIARSTPAQKPRGPASRISAMGAFIVTSLGTTVSLEEIGYPEYSAVELETAVGVGGVPVGDVLESVPRVDRRLVGDEERGAHAAPHHEREVRVDLEDIEVGAAGGGGRLDVRDEPTERQEVVAECQPEA